MTWTDLLNGFLKFASLSGLAAFVWQLWKAWDERRGRVSLVTKRASADTLAVAVNYRPKVQHAGLRMHAKAVIPKTARLGCLATLTGHEGLAETISKTARGLARERTCDGRLLEREGKDGVFGADLLVCGLGARARSQLVIEVWNEAERRLLDRRWVWVSSTD